MWAITNETPFAAERTFVRDRDGAEVWLVAVRGTFDILPGGELRVAEKQPPVVLAPAYRGDPSASSLLCDSDLVRTKLATDVLVNGSAYAPGGRPVPEVTVGLTVGPIQKRLTVTGDRVVRSGLFGVKASDPAPFVTKPINYEHAFGGTVVDPRDPAKSTREDANPVGIGLDGSVDRPLPNVMYAGDTVRPRARMRPAGFGPIASYWAPRVKRAGTYDAAWEATRQPLVPIDFDDRFFQAAPDDQQVPGFLRGGEEVVLQNLSPEGSLRFNLPRVTLGFATRIDGGTTNHRADLHTVSIEPDERRLVMVWHTALPCHHTLYTLKGCTVFEKKRIDWRASSAAEEADT